MRQVSLTGDRDARRAKAVASLREGWQRAEECGTSFASEEEIEEEIDRIRRMPEDDSECA
ncbi:MAG: hypothetical protein ABSF28_06140 [Terracidiphilus sp.]|jgi:hypothetical protein